MQTFWYRRLLLKDSSLLKKVEADFKAEGGRVSFLCQSFSMAYLAFTECWLVWPPHPSKSSCLSEKPS